MYVCILFSFYDIISRLFSQRIYALQFSMTMSYFQCTYVRMYVCTYVHMYVCTYVHMYVCTYVCMYVCTYVRMYVMCMYVCMHVCMYVHCWHCWPCNSSFLDQNLDLIHSHFNMYNSMGLGLIFFLYFLKCYFG